MTEGFIFAVCQVGAEPALKKELSREHPEFRFSYSRPGFVTFKRVDPAHALTPDFELKSVFARQYGLSIGKAGSKESSDEERARAVKQSFEEIRANLGNAGKNLNLHVFESDQYAPGEEPLGFVPGARAKSARAAIAAEMKSSFPELEINARSLTGETVLDVIVVEPHEWWLGLHEHGRARSADPGGRPTAKDLELPSEAPSRAYLKLEEGLAWSGAPIRKGDTAVEIGSAPGGASYALLKRGVSVTGVDPGKMDSVVLKMPGYRHIEKPVFYVERKELPSKVDWLLCDMNVDPKVAITSSDRLMRELRDSLLGLLLTVKLNKWEMAADVPGMIDYLKKSGLVRVRARQLANNRQEIFIYGLTRKGVSRLTENRA